MIGLLHPGSMGAAIGAGLVAAGHRVAWVAGRSPATAARAVAAGLTRLDDLADLVAQCDPVISIVPPAVAREVADAVLAAGFAGTYLDANAVGPETSRDIAARVHRAGGRFVDGAIVGPPPTGPGATRLFLAGPDAAALAALFGGGAVETVLVGAEPGAAAAVKMAYAGWSKGATALLLQVRSYARAWGVEDALLAEWNRSEPGLTERTTADAGRIHRKAWRFVGELREIERTMGAAGLPTGFHAAAAEVYTALASMKDAVADQDPALVLDRLRDQPG